MHAFTPVGGCVLLTRQFATNNKIEYFYDATGIKQRKIVTKEGVAATTEYAGKSIYQNNTLQFINHAEGNTRQARTCFMSL